MPARTRKNPESSPSAERTTTAGWNEWLDGSGEVRPLWRGLMRRLGEWTQEERRSLSATAAWMLEDLGATYNVYTDAGGAGQPYEIDPVPLLVAPDEWAHVSAGVSQRLRLLHAVLADLYGPQTLLQQGLIPPDLIHSNPDFQTSACGIHPPGGKALVTLGCDLVRNAAGGWTVVRDHTRNPGGLGQALENRNVTSSLLPELFESEKVARLGPFVEREKATLQALSPARTPTPHVVVLTPGFRHPSYFEHAYKARLLGFPLVETGDLTVRERRLFLKTLSGLLRIDGVACRLEEDAIDPLEEWTLGGGGVPGLMEAWRSGNVALANAPGTGFASSPALLPFLPEISRKWFGEELLLPFVETWWLGQEDVRQRVAEQFDRYVLLSAFRGDPLLPVSCAHLSPAARRQWMAAIEQQPHAYCVQGAVAPGLAPVLGERGIQARPVLWRTFALHAQPAPVVLPGGLARVGRPGHPPQLWADHAGFTKDVWVVRSEGAAAGRSEDAAPRQAAVPPGQSAASEVPSRIAEQLFWVGRYAERLEVSTRMLRVTLRRLSGEGENVPEAQLHACRALLGALGLPLPDPAAIPAAWLPRLLALVHDPRHPGSLASLVQSLLSNAAPARNRLSDDTWRFFNRLEPIVHAPQAPPRIADLLRTLDQLILHLSAFSGMLAENMTRGHGWRFLETGRRIERALGALGLLQTAARAGELREPMLEPLLETFDSVMTYRRRHFSRPRWEAVLDLLFGEPTNPRSVHYQMAVLQEQSSRFPAGDAASLPTGLREQLETLHLLSPGSAAPDLAGMAALAAAIGNFADLLSQQYFSHSVKRVY